MYATRIANPCEMYFSCTCPKCINTTLPIMPFRPKWQGVEKIMCYDKLNKLCKSVQIYASFDYVYCTNHHELVVSKQEYWPHYTEGFVVNKDGHCQLTIKDFVVRCYDSSQCSSTFNQGGEDIASCCYREARTSWQEIRFCKFAVSRI